MSNTTNESFTNESLILLYINKNSHYYDKVTPKLFEDRFLKRFYTLCQAFYKKYKVPLFDNNNKGHDQIRKFLTKHVEIATFDNKLTPDENIDHFIDNVKLVYKHDLGLYGEESVRDSFMVWAKVRSTYVAIVAGVEYFKKSKDILAEYDLKDISRELEKVKKIINGGFDFELDDDDGIDILDRQAHLQLSASSLFPTGYTYMDRWNSGQEEGRGGFEPGTLTYLLGPPNVGKSLFLWNIAYMLWWYGANVQGVSLEMATHKIAKRIGANAFNVNIGEYNLFANDEVKFNQAVQKFKMERNNGMPLNIGDGIESFSQGNMRIKRFASATVKDLSRLIDMVEDKRGYKVNALVLDYATELANTAGLGTDKMYSYHKENCNELFAMAVEKKLAVITAHQLHVKYKGQEDVTLQMIAESTAITQRPDYIYGIVQSEMQKPQNIFDIKLLKGRDTGQVGYRTTFEVDWRHMALIPKQNLIDPIGLISN